MGSAMRIGSTVLLTIGLMAGCSRERPREDTAAGPARAATSYQQGDTVALQRTLMDSSLQAPHIIQGVEVQLAALDTAGASQANLTAHKNLLSDMVTAMRADLNRVGVGDTAGFSALSDSVLRDLGGGTGFADGPDSAALPAHVERVHRLIALYGRTVSKARTAEGADSGTGP